MKLVSGTASGHLFSPKVPVTPATNYMFKAFLNVAAISSGEVGFYVDEYNSAGQWISGQFRKRENTKWVESMNFTYTPSSTSVASASLQVYVTGTGITAYVDNVQMLALGAETTPPPPSNLVANGTFDAGISSGWTTDSAATIRGGRGEPREPGQPGELGEADCHDGEQAPVLPAGGGHARVATRSPATSTSRRAPAVRWASTSTSTTPPGSGSPGSTNSGSPAAGVTNVNLTYSPSTTAVAKASLQVIVMGNSGVQAYFDDVRWTKP